MTVAEAQRSGMSESTSGMVLGAMAFALLSSVDVIYKIMAARLPIYEIIFINAIFALVPIVGWSLKSGGIVQLRTLKPGLHLVRGSTAVLSAFAAVFAYSRLPLTDFYAIVFAGPVLVTAMSSFWLGEVVDRLKWLAIVVGFCGILIVTNPFDIVRNIESEGASDMLMGRVAAFVSVFCYALSVIMIRGMRLGETNISFAFYGYGAALVIGGVLTLILGGPAVTMGDILHLMLSGTLAGLSGICMMTAYHRTPVALVAPFQYTQIIWGALAGYLIWEHLPGLRLVAGATLVALSGLMIVYQEMRGRTR